MLSKRKKHGICLQVLNSRAVKDEFIGVAEEQK